MKIVDIKMYKVSYPIRGQWGAGIQLENNSGIVEVFTDEGISGWGECYTQSDRDIQISSHVDQLSRYLIGRDPAQIKNFTQKKSLNN